MDKESTTATQKKYMQVRPRRRRVAERSDWGSSEGERTERPSSPATLSQKEEQFSAWEEPRPGIPKLKRPPLLWGAAPHAAGHAPPPPVSHPPAAPPMPAGAPNPPSGVKSPDVKRLGVKRSGVKRLGVKASSGCGWQRAEQSRGTSGWISAQRERREEETSMLRRPSRHVLQGRGRGGQFTE
jgi:hypothetical protein